MALHASRKYHSSFITVSKKFYNLMKPLGLTRYIEKPRVETREPAKAVMESASGLEPRIGLRA
jgi:hypothetical protein